MTTALKHNIHSPVKSVSASSSPVGPSVSYLTTPAPSSLRFINQLATRSLQDLESRFQKDYPKKVAAPSHTSSQAQTKTIQIDFEVKRAASDFLSPLFDRPKSSKLRSLSLPCLPEHLAAQERFTPYSSDEIFALELLMEKEALKKFAIASEYISLGLNLDKKLIVSLLKHVEYYKDQFNQTDAPLSLITGSIDSKPIQLLSSTDSVRFFFMGDIRRTGSSKTVLPLWTLMGEPKKEAILSSSATERQTLSEKEHLFQLKGKRSTIALRETFVDQDLRYFIQHYFSQNLANVIGMIHDIRTTEQRSAIEDPLKQLIAFQLLDALTFMHEKNILHNDVKPENVLHDHNHRIALGDFGVSLHESKVSPTMIDGSLRYFAIECFKGGLNSKASDVWSAGIVLWCLFAEKETDWMPYLNDETTQFGPAVAMMDYFTDSLRNTGSKDPLLLLFLDIFNPEPQERPSILAIKERLHEIFSAQAHETIYQRLTSSTSSPSTSMPAQLKPLPLRRHKTVYSELNYGFKDPNPPSRCWDQCNIL